MVIGTHEVLTNAHVVKDCTDITVRSSSTFSAAYVVAGDEENDLAVVHSNNSLPTAVSFRQGPVRAGDEVVALGYPLSGVLATTANLSVGNVSALAGMGDDSRFLQISAPVQLGNSGGPLLDASGHLIGIVTAKLNALRLLRATGDIPQNVNFALKTAVVRTFLDSNGIKYQTARSVLKLSPADVGEIARPFTVQIKCSGDSPNKETEQPPSPPPVQQTLPACGSRGVINSLMRIASNLRTLVFRVHVRQVSSTANMRFCRGVEWGSTGRRIFAYTVYWDNSATGQYRVNLTWYSP